MTLGSTFRAKVINPQLCLNIFRYFYWNTATKFGFLIGSLLLFFCENQVVPIENVWPTKPKIY
jgi:hypothetical protein